MKNPTVKKLTLLIADAHKETRDGVKLMLESQTDKYKFIFYDAENGEDAVEKSGNINFDMVIMDYQLTTMNGTEATRLIMSNKPESKILALSNDAEYTNIDHMIATGAKGFVFKNTGSQELFIAIETVLNGKNYYSSDIAARLTNNFQTTEKSKSKFVPAYALSKRELEILQLIASEYTNEEIANKLFVSKRTIDTHRQNLLNKLGVKNTVGLVKYAIEIKLTE